MTAMLIMIIFITMFFMIFFHLHMLLSMNIISISKIEHDFFQNFSFHHVGALNVKSFRICWWKDSFFAMLIMIIFITMFIIMIVMSMCSFRFNVIWKTKNTFLISKTNTKVTPVTCFGDTNFLSSFSSIRIC